MFTDRGACGIGFVANTSFRPSREIIDSALEGLCRVAHRGAVAADNKTGDGAGLLFPIPMTLLSSITGADSDFLGIASVFVWPSETSLHRAAIEQACRQEAIDVVQWREVPLGASALGDTGKRTMPGISQAILLRPLGVSLEEAERRCIHARKRAEKACEEAGVRVYFPSFSFRTVTYKALTTGRGLAEFYPDLKDSKLRAPFAIFHQRFSTNTSPAWERAQPLRTLCHNGEINTIRGNLNRMRAREGRLGKVDLLEEDRLRPVVEESGSDSAMLDNVVELLTREGRDIRHAVSMLVPAAWETDPHSARADFYKYHSALMEPWDGPAGLIFTDGVRVGAALDRNGLRPLRYFVCEDGFVAACSEAGGVPTEGRGLVRRRKLGPGQMLCLDPEQGLDEDPILELARRRPYGAWVRTHTRLANADPPRLRTLDDLTQRQVVFGYTKEEFTSMIRPMATTGHEPTSSMGDDTAPAVLSDLNRNLYNYFKQRFAQVTNPAIDHLRERSMMSLRTLLGPRDPLLWERPAAAALTETPSFFVFKPPGGYLIDATWDVQAGVKGLREAVDRIAGEAQRAAVAGNGILVISDLEVSADRAPIPMLMAVGAVHQRLVLSGHRTRVSLGVETDEAREAHHFAALIGYGAEVVCPRLVLSSIADLADRGRLGDSIPAAEAVNRYRTAVEEGVLKIMSKMGISTIDSYCGAGVFDAVGLDQEVIDLCFSDTASPLGGATFEDIATNVLTRHIAAYSFTPRLSNPGYFKHHNKGEYHATNPSVVSALHGAVESQDWDAYREYAALVETRPPVEPRDLLDFVFANDAIDINEVEPVEAITRRFSSGAISHGSIGAEAHETTAIALNMVGGKSNTGEGGEDPARFKDERNCRIKQVASGRFGVTPEYCSYADELQIKIAQGSKPGEGGQLPGNKVTEEIARLRHTQPGVGLISPPPHHDIYSIEDLAQLIFDLKQVSPRADVSVKLVSEVGVGTVATGVVKALADVVHIAGANGGTGASPLSSIKNAGLSWEYGLAETRVALMENGLREHVRLRVDGGLKSGRDVMMAALLGADEFAFGTTVLMAQGCIMVRACHRDTCPVGIATQRLDLRKKFAGTPDKVATYLSFVAEEVRRLLALMGLRTLEEAIGRVDLLSSRPGKLNFQPILQSQPGRTRFHRPRTGLGGAQSLGDKLFGDAWERLMKAEVVDLSYQIRNSDRAVGARLGGAIAHRFGDGAPPGRVVAKFEGAAGQSFGAFLTSGIELHLTGEANDGLGKGMSGGLITVSPPANDWGDPVIAGNALMYGATGGRVCLAGRVGERFCVRNSGATAVSEGAGDHACEYMTGGTVVILGPVGHNFGAGMTGGRAFVWSPAGDLEERVNSETVEVRRLDAGHEADLLDLVADHAEMTGSKRALTLLERWEGHVDAFFLVAPKASDAKAESAYEVSVEVSSAAG